MGDRDNVARELGIVAGHVAEEMRHRVREGHGYWKAGRTIESDAPAALET